MFTGIVEIVGTVRSNRDGRMWIDCGFASELGLGQSVSCSGVCLSVVEIDDRGFAVQMIQETLERTYFSSLKSGSFINLERAMRADGRFDGHIVQGHVDGVGKRKEKREKRKDEREGIRDERVERKEKREKRKDESEKRKDERERRKNSDIEMVELDVELPIGLEKYVVEKGSICLDGISLTVMSVVGDLVTVGIIPHTWQTTNLRTKQLGSQFNVEVDVVAKYLERMLGRECKT